jgi:hypothetical protein
MSGKTAAKAECGNVGEARFFAAARDDSEWAGQPPKISTVPITRAVRSGEWRVTSRKKQTKGEGRNAGNPAHSRSTGPPTLPRFGYRQFQVT